MRFTAAILAGFLTILTPSLGRADEAALRDLAGRFGWEASQAPALRSTLPQDAIAWMESNLDTAPRNVLMDDRYLVVTGCRRHACGKVETYAAIDVASGSWLFAKSHDGKKGVITSVARSWDAPPTVMADFQRWKDSLR